MKNRKNQSKVAKAIVNALLTLFLLFSLLTTVLAISSTRSSDGVPNLLGYSLMAVQTDSMAPEFHEGDMILVRLMDDEEKNTIKEGDIITFVDESIPVENGKIAFNTHRVIERHMAGSLLDYCITQGDNREMCPMPDMTRRYSVDIRGVYSGKTLPGFGKVLEFLCSSTGFLVCVLIPLILVFIYEVIDVVRAFMKIKNKDKKVISAAEEELIKQQAIAEYLQRQAAEKQEQEESASQKQE